MFFTKKNKVFKKIGYYKDQKGIMNRYQRERNNWALHTEQTRQFILRCAENKKKNKVIVLGSGWLLDVPIEELAKIFKEVILIDVIHPPEIIKKISVYQNVKHYEFDITGYAQWVSEYKNEQQLAEMKQDRSFIEFLKTMDCDFFISVNILNQLDILFVDFLKENWVLKEKDLLDFSRKIQSEHLKLLPHGKSCLVTDVQENNYINDKLVRSNPLVHVQLPASQTQERWQWIFDTKKMYYNFDKTILDVYAIDF